MSDVNEIFWTNEARQDLARLIEPLHVQNPRYAQKLLNRLISTVQRLAVFPESGRYPPEFLDSDDFGLRETIIAHLRVMYLYFPNRKRVEIQFVFSAREDVVTHLQIRLSDDT